MRGAVTIAVLLITGVAVIWAGTDGLRVLTAEGARRIAIEEKPEPLPATLLRDQRGEAFRLQDFQGSNLLVEFIYTRCVTLCNSLGETFEEVSERLPAGYLGSKVNLISISFDPRDDVAALMEYGKRFDAVPEHWRIARVENPEDIQPLLDTFGITVIPDNWGNFEHNAAVHFVNRQGDLDKIVDHDPPNKALEALWKRL
ncbi:MAG: SCO family protein [Mariprofundaceae bacterium]